MAAEALRVALLARPGLACDRLRGVLAEAGAEAVLEADPTTLELPALVGAAPEVVLVALDPAVEDVLERFDEVLFDPSIDVIYEEAVLTASREGWDVARWQRHLVAKLNRHGDVLPPGREPDDVSTPIVADALEGSGHAGDEPAAVDGLGTVGELAAPDEFTLSEEFGLPVPADEVEGVHHNPFDPVMAEFDYADLDSGEAHGGTGIDFSPDFDDAVVESRETAFAEPGFVEPEFAAREPVDPALADPEIADPELAHPEPAPVPEEPAARTGFGELTLDDGSGGAVAENREIDHRFRHDLDDLEQRISGLQLVDDTPARGPEQARGAVLVLAGIGGPDAVRQLLGALPPEFPRPVLVQQRLDGARYDKLVAQMQRATSAPVQLAEPGQPAQPGSVYILPAGVGIDIEDAGIRFNGDGDLLEALPSADSAVLLLSGSDPGQVDAVMKHSWAGALVAGQAADGCYDAAASNALASRGGDTAPAAELAQRLAERWS